MLKNFAGLVGIGALGDHESAFTNRGHHVPLCKGQHESAPERMVDRMHPMNTIRIEDDNPTSGDTEVDDLKRVTHILLREVVIFLGQFLSFVVPMTSPSK